MRFAFAADSGGVYEAEFVAVVVYQFVYCIAGGAGDGETMERPVPVS